MMSNDATTSSQKVDQTEADQSEANKEEKKKTRASYIERALGWFLKNRVFGGIQTLRQKEYVGFFYTGLGILCTTTAVLVLSLLTPILDPGIVQLILAVEFFASFGFIISGLVAGRLSPGGTYGVSVPIIVGFGILGYLFHESYTHWVVGWVQLAFLLMWVIIAVFSMFFLGRSYFTSLASKIVAIGNPRDRIFFAPLVKVVAIIATCVFIYMSFAGEGWWMGLIGLVFEILILQKIYQKRTGEETTFASILAFFNVYLFYHLVSAFSTTSFTIPALLLDIALTTFISLYIVQSWTRRLGKIDELEAQEPGFAPRPVFQNKLGYASKVKQTFGEKGLVLMAFGVVLGYHTMMLGAYLGTSIPLIDLFGPDNLHPSASFHRVFILVCILLGWASIIAYKRSEGFRTFVSNKFTITQVFRVLLQWFRRGDEGERAPIELLFQNFGEGIRKAGQDLKDRILGKRDEVAGNVKQTQDEIGQKLRETGEAMKQGFQKLLGSFGSGWKSTSPKQNRDPKDTESQGDQ